MEEVLETAVCCSRSCHLSVHRSTVCGEESGSGVTTSVKQIIQVLINHFSFYFQFSYTLLCFRLIEVNSVQCKVLDVISV